ncbi:MAG: alpha/beta fold hydrolase [Acidimicrobiales bacterium]
MPDLAQFLHYIDAPEADVTTKNITVDGVRLVYDDDGTGMPLLFLHGGSASADYWESLVPMLLDDYRCLRLEFAGHGRSDRSPAGAYSINDQARAAIALLEQETGPAVIVGQSGGAATAFAAAAKRPELVRAIYCEDAYPGIYTAAWIGSNPFVRGFTATGEIFRSLPEGFSAAQLAAATGATQRAPGLTMMDLLGPEAVAFMARIRLHTDPLYFDTVVDPGKYWTEDDVAAVIAAVRCPVHIAYGDLNTGSLVPETEIDALVSAGMNVTRQHFPGASHVITPFNTRAVHEDLRRFLAQLNPAAN